MMTVTMTEQEKKELAVIYGFLVDVWTAQQSKAVGRSAILKHGKGKAGANNNN